MCDVQHRAVEGWQEGQLLSAKSCSETTVLYCHKWSFITAMSEYYQKNKCYCLFPWRSFPFPGEPRNRGVVQLCQLQSGEQAAGGISVWTGSSGCRQQCQTQDTALAQLLKTPLVSTSSHLMQRSASGWALSLGYVRMFRLVQRKVWNGEVTGECVN